MTSKPAEYVRSEMERQWGRSVPWGMWIVSSAVRLRRMSVLFAWSSSINPNWNGGPEITVLISWPLGWLHKNIQIALFEYVWCSGSCRQERCASIEALQITKQTILFWDRHCLWICLSSAQQAIDRASHRKMCICLILWAFWGQGCWDGDKSPVRGIGCTGSYTAFLLQDK